MSRTTVKQSYAQPVIAPLRVAPDGFVYADGVKVARYIPERQTLQFVDKDRRSISARGTRYVEVAVTDVLKLAKGGSTDATP